jgi:hypothetical protein
MENLSSAAKEVKAGRQRLSNVSFAKQRVNFINNLNPIDLKGECAKILGQLGQQHPIDFPTDLSSLITNQDLTPYFLTICFWL